MLARTFRLDIAESTWIIPDVNVFVEGWRRHCLCERERPSLKIGTF